METVVAEESSADISSVTSTTNQSAVTAEKVKPAKVIDSFGFFSDAIEQQAPPPVDDSVEWTDDDNDAAAAAMRGLSNGSGSPVTDNLFTAGYA